MDLIKAIFDNACIVSAGIMLFLFLLGVAALIAMRNISNPGAD